MNVDREYLAGLIEQHRWLQHSGECTCGWTQKDAVGFRWAYLNWPHHLADVIHRATLDNPPTGQ